MLGDPRIRQSQPNHANLTFSSRPGGPVQAIDRLRVAAVRDLLVGRAIVRHRRGADAVGRLATRTRRCAAHRTTGCANVGTVDTRKATTSALPPRSKVRRSGGWHVERAAAPRSGTTLAPPRGHPTRVVLPSTARKTNARCGSKPPRLRDRRATGEFLLPSSAPPPPRPRLTQERDAPRLLPASRGSLGRTAVSRRYCGRRRAHRRESPPRPTFRCEDDDARRRESVPRTRYRCTWPSSFRG